VPVDAFAPAPPAAAEPAGAEPRRGLFGR